jgi:hypothetical protein
MSDQPRNASQPKPVAGVDTPKADDIIVPCAGGCGRWVVREHPRHITGGSDVFGGDWKPTPAWVAAEAAHMEEGAESLCPDCGANRPSTSPEKRAAVTAHMERMSALKEYTDPAGPKAREAQDRYAKSKALLDEMRAGR